jgi:hypothetical protein
MCQAVLEHRSPQRNQDPCDGHAIRFRIRGPQRNEDLCGRELYSLGLSPRGVSKDDNRS